jgi:pimeloyl-ACP methyl ester carboxylesterase
MADPPELAGVRHEYLDAGGLRTHVALAGPEDGPPLLLVHGWPQNWWSWRNVIPALSQRFRVIAPDLRGHGWTQAPAGGYAKEQLTSDLLALLDALEIERITWIGHDWGGWTGLLGALRSPARFERLLVLCIPHPWTKPQLRRLGVFLSYQGPISLPFAGPRVADRMVRGILQTGRHGERLSGADVAIYAEHLPPHVTVAMYRTFLTRELLPAVRGRYAREVLQVPTTLLAGARDPITQGIPVGSVRGQPNLEVRELDGVAHWVPEQRPQAVIDWANSA